MDSRKSPLLETGSSDILSFKAEFQALKNLKQGQDDAGGEEVHSITAVPEPRCSSGTAVTGCSLAAPYALADVEPLAWKRAANHSSVRKALSEALNVKWAESMDETPRALPEMLDAGDNQLRGKLLVVQGQCLELKPLLEAANRLLTATYKDSVKEAAELAKDYRLNPEDGDLERAVSVTRVIIWVPVMPATALPSKQSEAGAVTWRRYAFERAHCVCLEPHRPPGNTWQALKRMAFWQGMHKDFNMWIHSCAVCHQYRTVGQMAPMRSTVASGHY